jgi:hypothetical protein
MAVKPFKKMWDMNLGFEFITSRFLILIHLLSISFSNPHLDLEDSHVGPTYSMVDLKKYGWEMDK